MAQEIKAASWSSLQITREARQTWLGAYNAVGMLIQVQGSIEVEETMGTCPDGVIFYYGQSKDCRVVRRKMVLGSRAFKGGYQLEIMGM